MTKKKRKKKSSRPDRKKKIIMRLSYIFIKKNHVRKKESISYISSDCLISKLSF